MSKFSIKDLALQSIIAALYVILVYIFQFASFNAIQFRIAEAMMILIFFNKKSIIGLTIGCLLSNIFFSPTPWDIVFGTLATLIAGVLMYVFKNKLYLALLMPAIINGLIVGLMITYVFDTESLLYINIATVFLGEFVVLFVLGLPLYHLLKINDSFKELIE